MHFLYTNTFFLFFGTHFIFFFSLYPSSLSFFSYIFLFYVFSSIFFLFLLIFLLILLIFLIIIFLVFFSVSFPCSTHFIKTIYYPLRLMHHRKVLVYVGMGKYYTASTFSSLIWTSSPTKTSRINVIILCKSLLFVSFIVRPASSRRA